MYSRRGAVPLNAVYRPWRGYPRRGPYPWPAIVLPWGRYVRARYLFWRIRLPLWMTLCAGGWVLFDTLGLVGGLAVAYLVEAAFSYRRPTGEGPGHSSEEVIAAARAEARLVERRWRTESTPSPGGWQPPPGSIPAWDWTPPYGLKPRLDRIPVWVRLWYRTPFLDRYAYAWMWTHGGWDVLPAATDRR